MKKTYILSAIIAIMAISICSCTKIEVIDVQGEVLTEVKVPVTAGEFLLPITVNDATRLAWRARSLSDWLHVLGTNADWKQNAYNITVNYESNESSQYMRNFARKGYLVIETYDGFVADTVVVKQRGITPYMHLEDTTVEATETECTITFDSNLIDDCRQGLVLSAEDADWIESIEYLSNGTQLFVKFSPNMGTEQRVATLKVVYTDVCDDSTTETCTLTQKAVE